MRGKIMFVIFLLIFFVKCNAKIIDSEKQEFCAEIETCDISMIRPVCGIRTEGELFHLKLFKNECELLRFGCKVENETEAYGIINREYCDNAFEKRTDFRSEKQSEVSYEDDPCKYDCSKDNIHNIVCGLRPDGIGFKIRLFANECELQEYNCKEKVNFNITDLFICRDLDFPELKSSITRKSEIVQSDATSNTETATNFLKNVIDVTELDTENATAQNMKSHLTELYDNDTKDVNERSGNNPKKVIVVDGSMFDFNGNINDTIDNFYSATHVFDLPLQKLEPTTVQMDGRRKAIKIFKSAVVYTPAITIPKVFHEGKEYEPTLNSCYHKCPQPGGCPDTYAPVCGVPGVQAREPSLMFKNHCFMDLAQCKMRQEDKSPTAESSAYMELSFVFCIGDALNGVYRFLPLVRTLQHMGRLKKKGKFHYKFRNMRFLNNWLSREPNLMG